MSRNCRNSCVGLLALAAALWAPCPAKSQDSSQATLKEEIIIVTSPPQCELKATVIRAKERELQETTVKLLRSMGYGVAGIPEGCGLPVKCDGTTASGWIDREGEIQSVISPKDGWFVEKHGTEIKRVDGKLHVITKKVLFEKKNVEATYAIFVGGPLSEYSTRLLRDIGMGIRGTASTVLVKLDDGRELKGLLASNGILTVTADRWER